MTWMWNASPQPVRSAALATGYGVQDGADYFTVRLDGDRFVDGDPEADR